MQFSTREDIAAPIEEVYAALTNFDAMERAVMRRGAEVQRTDRMTEPGPGMSWEARFTFREKERVLTTEITELARPDAIRLKSDLSGLHGQTDLELVALTPTQTRLSVGLEMTPTSMPARVFLQTLRLARAKLNQRFNASVERFARAVEDGKFSK